MFFRHTPAACFYLDLYRCGQQQINTRTEFYHAVFLPCAYRLPVFEPHTMRRATVPAIWRMSTVLPSALLMITSLCSLCSELLGKKRHHELPGTYVTFSTVPETVSSLHAH